MQKRAYFDDFWGEGWPAVDWLEPFFLTKAGQERLCGDVRDGNDSWGFDITDLYANGHLPRRDSVDVHLYLTANPTYGVTLQYSRWDGTVQRRDCYLSKGNLGRLDRFVRSLHDDRFSLGLFIPFEAAWKAVKEFIETDGELPTSIEWVANQDLPPNRFPDP